MKNSRFFSTTLAVAKKQVSAKQTRIKVGREAVSEFNKIKNSKKSTPQEGDVLVPIYEPSEFKTAAENVVERFGKRVQELRLGKADLSVLNRLRVTAHKEKYQLDEIAQVTTRGGRQILVSVYDPDVRSFLC